MNHRLIRRALVAAGALLAVSPLPAAAAPVRPAPSGSLATFAGHQIALAEGWDEATACAVTDAGTTCYRTEAEMDAAIAAPPTTASAGETSWTTAAASAGGTPASSLCGSGGGTNGFRCRARAAPSGAASCRRPSARTW